MIYTRTKIDHPLFEDFKTVSESKLETNSIYWYDKHDAHLRGIPFDSFLDSQHWDHIHRDQTSKILFYYGDEYFNLFDIDMYADTIKARNINPSQIYFIVIDKTWTEWVITEFKNRGIVGINVTDHNLLLKKTIEATSTPLQNIKKYFERMMIPKVEKKFSAFSRRFDHWRLQLFVELHLKNLLPNFKYTFNNVDPYVGVGINNAIRVFEKDEIIKILASKNYNIGSVDGWISNVPYTFPVSKTWSLDKWTTCAQKWITESAFHLLVESHYDPFNHFWDYAEQRQYGIREFAPSLITEKIWKVISSCRPFVVFSTPYFLEDLKSLGFQTFHPFINESYDKIEDQNERMTAIVHEIDRLNNLSADEFDYVFKECYNIALQNYKVCKALYSEIIFENEFEWVNQYLRKEMKDV